MPTDLEGELDVLGTWLQRHQETITGGRIRATVGSRRLASGSPDPVEVVLDDAVPGGPGGPGGRVAARPDRRHPIRRTSWLVAAAIVLVCLAAGTFLALTRPGSAPASLPTGPTDPTGALYVMPSAGSAAPTRNATSMAAAVAPSRARGAVVGVPDGDWYRGVVTIAVVDERPEPAGAGGWQQVDRTSGPALTSSDGVMSRVAQQRGPHWLLVAGRLDGQAHALDVLDQIDVDAAGGITPAEAGEVEVVGTIDDRPVARTAGVFFELTNETTVETATVAGLVEAIGQGDDARPVLINGTAGWWLTRRDADGVWNAVVWMGTPHRMIAVSGHAPLTTVTDVAADLVIVDEATWTEALDPQ